MQEAMTLVFSEKEFQDRLRKVRSSMQISGLDILLVHTPENIFYLTGYQTPGYYTYQCLVLPITNEPIIVTRQIEVTNVKARSWVKHTATFIGLEDTSGQNPVEVTCRVLQEIGGPRPRIGVEKGSWFLTPLNLESLEQNLHSKFVDATNIVNDVRLVKSANELINIRQAARSVEKGMSAAIESIHEGKIDLEVAAAFHAASILAGSEYPGLPPFIATGKASAIAHATWEGRKINRGDAVFLELPGCVNRYHAALERTAIVGKAPDKWVRIAEAVIGGLNAAIEAIKPGVTSGEVDAACRKVIGQAGFGQYYLHRCGYSIGIAFPPDWGEGHIFSLRANDNRVLEAGMVFHIPPGVFIYGEVGIAFSETVTVTETGCEVITSYPRRLFVID